MRRFASTAARDKWNSVIHGTVKPATQTTPSTLTYAIKDNIASAGDITSCASKMLANYTSPFDATVVALLNDAGHQSIGKVNLDEFGMGSANTNSHYGPVVNPRYSVTEPHITGGSSGGSAAAVAAGLCDFALGTDTGGSVRLPAAYCEVYGYKPTYGRVSRWGVVPYAQTLDTVGILADSVDVLERVFAVVDRYDESDPTSMPEKYRIPAPTPSEDRKYTVGIPEEFVLDELSPEMRRYWTRVLAWLAEQGHSIRSVSVPSITKSLATYYTIATAEVASNLSRYDGVRYGFSGGVGAFSDVLHRSRASFGPEAQRRIILGNYSMSSESGHHYLHANQVRRDLVHEFNAVFAQAHPYIASESGECDVLVYPTSFGTPPTIEEYETETTENFVVGYVNDILTVPASLAGLPTMSVPLGQGIQISGQFNDDATVMSVARLFEQIAV
ncbi:glutamyl-tRNA(Gln) amidotransferase subunit A, mitochondrial [Diutina catenulata]